MKRVSRYEALADQLNYGLTRDPLSDQIIAKVGLDPRADTRLKEIDVLENDLNAVSRLFMRSYLNLKQYMTAIKQVRRKVVLVLEGQVPA